MRIAPNLWRAGAAAASLASLFPLITCAHALPDISIAAATSASPAVAWQPPPEARQANDVKPHPSPEIPAEWKTQGAILSLSQVVDLALKNNPATQAAWFQARSAAAQLGSVRSEYLPQVSVGANITRQRQSAVGGQPTYLQTTYGPSISLGSNAGNSSPGVTLNYLLFDFGGRSADVDEALQKLYSADWRHNAAIQDLILQVELTYYDYLDAKAQHAAAQANLKEAQENLDAARARHDAGIATIADVLQAKTALSLAQLQLDTVEGQIQTIRGALATALGLPASYASLPIDVGELPENVDVESVNQEVDRLIEHAQAQRPDLAAARANVARSSAHIRSVHSEGLPTIGVTGSANRTYYDHPAADRYSLNYSGAVQLQIPLFTGFKNSYDLLQAREDAGAAQADFDTLHQKVILQVWTSFYNLKTAAQRVRSSRDLLDSARQSAEVALGRYRNGVGSILDLLTAQSALAAARAQEVQSRADWFQSIADLAHDTGAIGPLAAGQAPQSETKGTP